MADEVIAVAHAGDVIIARQAAKTLAIGMGFDERASEEITIAVSELAFNLVKHAHDGRLRLTSLDSDGRLVLQIESQDTGPGIADVERALTDGFSTAGSLGYGLGTVARLMDTCEVTSQPGAGTQIIARRWLPAAQSTAPYPLDFGVATRPCRGWEVNGDTFVVTRWGAHALAGVIDGLGHGSLAHQAAQTARHYVERHHDRPLEEIFRGVAGVCRATRGVVMALARFDAGVHWVGDGIHTGSWQPAPIRLSFASIGNVEARVLHPPEPINLALRRGVLGGTAPAALRTEHAWDLRSMLVLHSDGLPSRWRWEDFPGLPDQPASAGAQRLLQALAKDEDDATVVVIKGKHS